MKLLMLKGLPASGKSTYAEECVKDGWVRVNKDLLRTMLHFDEWTRNNEKTTQQVEVAVAIEALSQGRSVVVDDTNLGERHKSLWSNVAKNTEAKFEIKEFDTPVGECIERDKGRDKEVGRHVIINMAMQYSLLPNLKDIIVVDIDGTLADGSDRVHHVQKEPKDWQTYFSLMYQDTLRVDVKKQVEELQKETNATVIIVSARPEDYRFVTEKWLDYHNIDRFHLIMRNQRDRREDSVVKKEIYNKYLKNYNIVKVFDDRPKVIRMWRELGLDVCDVGNGVEF